MKLINILNFYNKNLSNFYLLKNYLKQKIIYII